MGRRDRQPELYERAAARRREPPEGRGIGERFAGAFFGGLFGVALGFVIAGVHFFLVQAAFRYDLVGATVLYSAAFTFIFGDMLGDAWMGFFRLFEISKSIEQRYPRRSLREADAGDWFRSFLALVLFSGPLALVIYLVLKHHPG